LSCQRIISSNRCSSSSPESEKRKGQEERRRKGKNGWRERLDEIELTHYPERERERDKEERR
jgi:hypothetical protein